MEATLPTVICPWSITVGVVLCPAPSLEEEGSEDTRGISVADWNAISAEWAGFLLRDRKNDVVQLP